MGTENHFEHVTEQFEHETEQFEHKNSWIRTKGFEYDQREMEGLTLGPARRAMLELHEHVRRSSGFFGT
jgi:hypothetical protein